MSTTPEKLPELPDPPEQEFPQGTVVRSLRKELKMIKRKGDENEEVFLPSQLESGETFNFVRLTGNPPREKVSRSDLVTKITKKGDHILVYTGASVYVINSTDVKIVLPKSESPQAGNILTKLRNLFRK